MKTYYPSLVEMHANDDEICRIVDSVALCESRPVPHETLMRALLDQNGHYVSDEVVALMEVAGCSPRSGTAIVTLGRCPREILPPGAVVRETAEHDVVFYEEHDRGRPWRGKLDYGTIAVAAGRLGDQAIGIIKARWMFPNEAP